MDDLSKAIHVLLLSEDTDLSEQIATGLPRHSTSLFVDTTDDVARARESIVNDSVDCFLINDGDATRRGIDWVDSIRNGYPALPVILVTETRSDAEGREALEAGATDVVQITSGGDRYPLLANRIVSAVEYDRLLRRVENPVTETDEDAPSEDWSATERTGGENLVAIVDCSGSDDQQAIEELATERVSSPGDLTGISIGTAKLLQQFSTENIKDIRHGLVSISTLIQYLDLNTVFKFLHIYTSRIEDTNGLGIFTMDSQAHGPQTTSTVTAEFDAVIELRENDVGSRDVRIRGLPNTDRTWRPYP